jgi:hypothetical protein
MQPSGDASSPGLHVVRQRGGSDRARPNAELLAGHRNRATGSAVGVTAVARECGTQVRAARRYHGDSSCSDTPVTTLALPVAQLLPNR